MLKSIFKNVASTHRRVPCVSNACDICSVQQRQNSLLLSLQTSSAQRMRAIVSLSWHTWPHSHKEWGSSWHGRDEERRNREGHSGLPRAAWTVQPPQEHPGMWKHHHPCFKGWAEYSSRFTASQRRRVKVQINARGEWSQEPTRYNCDFLHRTGEASQELGPPKSPQLGSVVMIIKCNLAWHQNVANAHI